MNLHHIPNRTKKLPPLRVGIGGPVGSGKTTLLEMLCKAMRDQYDLVAITNDIYTKEDQRLLTVSGALPAERIMGVETGGCPHTAIREDASINLEAIDRMLVDFPNADIVFIESGGDNLAATFSPELSDLTIYVIDVAAGEKIPRKGGPGITKSDLFVINKTDLAPYVGANLDVMDADTLRMRTTAIELNPQVVAACRGWFKLPADNTRMQVILADAAQEIQNPRWWGTIDALQVDLYDHEAAAPVLDSAAFYADCRRLLTEDGCMTVNLFGRSSSFARSVEKISSAFGADAVWAFKSTREGNTVVLAQRTP